jgi:hypothetical protein
MPRRAKAAAPAKKDPAVFRYSVVDDSSKKTLAVVEARDAIQALVRFQRVRGMVYKATRLVAGDVLTVSEQAPEVPVHSALFTDGFFDMLDASEALKH